MNGFRYVVAVLTAVSIPPAIAYWLAVHPFVRFWRRLGARASFAILWSGFLGAIVACWFLRDALVGRDLGTNFWLLVPGAVLYLAAAQLSREATRHLTLRMLAGVPEISAAHGPGRMLDRGIYARIRHPRYAAYLVGAIGVSLIANYSGLYLMAALLFPALHLIAVIEERELHERFGPAWAAYAAAVPRLVPRFRRPRDAARA